MRRRYLCGLITALSVMVIELGWTTPKGRSQDDLIEASSTLTQVKDSAPILSLQALGGGNLISAGTADGKTHFWRYYNGSPVPLEPPAADPIATLVLGGKSRTLIRAGFDPSPSVGLLPGKYLGSLDLGGNQARFVATRIHDEKQWLAIRFDDRIEIRTRGMAANEQPITLPGEYRRIAWGAGPGSSLQLIASRGPVADGFAELHAWTIGGANVPSAEVIGLPASLTATEASFTSLATAETDPTLVTGDSYGGVRWWRTGQSAAESLPFGPVAKAHLSEYADALVFHRTAKLHLLNPLSFDPIEGAAAIDTRDAKPILLAHCAIESPAPARHFVSVAWPEKLSKYELQIFEFGKTMATLNGSVATLPTALALHPSGNQLAVATKEDGAVFFSSAGSGAGSCARRSPSR